ncbi:CD209 antigen-like protein C [Aquarana catesbeiana]|uniref:CD209 antigen-like protein C n=1 Tax=Aquarana catesbeiana TaxID=8400 RepID=UPI003CC96C5C
MRKTEDLRVNSGDSSDDNTYVNLQDFKAQKIENHPNHEGPPAAKNTQNKIILILMVLLILMFLILAILMSLLFINYITISEELSQMKKKKEPSCESDWLEFEDHCYFFSNFRLNWTKAEKMCLNRESHLVIVNNEAEQKFLTNDRNGGIYWIGLTNLETNNTFKWVDGTGLSYQFFHPGEPNNLANNEGCVQILYEQWNDSICGLDFFAICEKRLI